MRYFCKRKYLQNDKRLLSNIFVLSTRLRCTQAPCIHMFQLYIYVLSESLDTCIRKHQKQEKCPGFNISVLSVPKYECFNLNCATRIAQRANITRGCHFPHTYPQKTIVIRIKRGTTRQLRPEKPSAFTISPAKLARKYKTQPPLFPSPFYHRQKYCSFQRALALSRLYYAAVLISGARYTPSRAFEHANYENPVSAAT